MPLYEYACTRCRHRFETLQRIDDDASGLECPNCHGSQLEKQFSTFASNTGGKAATAASACTPGSGFT